MSDLIRVLVADDHPVVRQGLVSIITPGHGMEVVGEAADGAEAVAQARALQPDVIQMDLLMPCKTGLEAITEIKEDNPQTRILVLTSFGEEDRVSDAIRAGALGFLIKDSSTDDLFHAIREVYADNLSLPPEIARRLMQNLQQPKHEQSPVDVLTKREIDALQAVARGLANREIAEELAINEATVRSHVNNLLDKLGLSNRRQAALYAIDAGLVDHE